MMFIGVLVGLFTVLLLGSIFTTRILARRKLSVSLKKSVETGSMDDAIQALRQVIEKDPTDFVSWVRLVRTYMEITNYEEAIKQLNNLILAGSGKNGFNEREANILLATCYMKTKNYEDAYKMYTVLRHTDPDDPLPYLQLGRIEKERGDTEKAVKYLARASSLAPEDSDVIKEHAILLYDLKKSPDALPLFKNVLGLKPEDPEANFYLGQIFMQFQNFKTAYGHFLKAKNDGNFSIRSLVNIGAILGRFNKLEESATVLSSVLRRSKIPKEDMLEARYHLGETFLAQKDVQNAIAQWEKILSTVQEYRDVSMKLERFEQMKSNSKMHNYMMCSFQEFVQICERVTKNFARSVVIIRTEPQRDLSVDIYTQAVYKDVSAPILFKYFRGTTNVGQLAVREFYEKLKEMKAKRGICFTTADYTEEAHAFATGRVLELHGKRELMRLLAKK